MSITLEVVKGPHQGQRFTFDGHDNFIVGRAPCAHFRLPKDDRYISRVHFLIEFNPPLCRLADLGSSNGTGVNGTRVEKANLKHGDLIEAGKTVFRVHIDAAAEAETISLPSASPRSGPSLPPPPTDLPQGAGHESHRIEATSDAMSAPLDQTEPALPTIAGFQIAQELGRGGMGVVYLAQSLSNNVQVAIKTIRPTVSGAQQEIDRFLREARILSQLQHPGIVRFEEMGRAGDLLYFVMEYVKGSDGARELKKHARVAIRPVVGVICQALHALHYAHEQGYVHRDVKPSNLLLTKTEAGTICKLADFGLARAYNSSPLSGLTMMGDIGGTLPYMPPEQITDYRHARPPADQYATAATLYHMLTGHYVFDFDDTPGERRISKILCDPPVPIKARRGDIPDGLAWVIDRGLEKNPEKRFPHAAAFRDALLPYAGDQ